MSSTPEETGRAGLVALVGATNVGKSTLINALVGEKVSIVTPVVQTTRNVIRAIRTETRGQLVLLDTPGVHKARYDLGRMMNRMARHTIEGVDVVLLVLDTARPPRETDEGWMRRLLRPDQEAAIGLVFNKTDCPSRYEADYHALWERLLLEKGTPPTIIPIHRVAAIAGTGVEALLACLFDHMPVGPPLFPADILTDYPRKLAIADVIREKYAPHLKDELPHALAVWIESIEETPPRWRINGTVYVDRHSQKGIVLGQKGRLLKKVTHAAETELASIYDTRVTLKLWVKAEKDWMRNYWMLQKLGYT